MSDTRISAPEAVNPLATGVDRSEPGPGQVLGVSPMLESHFLVRIPTVHFSKRMVPLPASPAGDPVQRQGKA